MSTHLALPGETFLVGWDDSQSGTAQWRAVCSDEITVRAGRTLLQVGETERIELDPEASMVARIWRPHPRQNWQADSPTRALQTDLAKLCALDQRVLAEVDSRLAGNGMLIVPESATVLPASPQQAAEDVHDDPFIAEMTRAMVTPMNNREDASAVVPIVVRVDDAATGKFEHLRFSTPFDERTAELAEMALRKLALGMDVPPEIILGMADVNHWTGWLLNRQAVDLHVKPELSLICHALTEAFLAPMLLEAGIDPDGYVLAANTQDLTDQSTTIEEAQTLYDKGLISREALLRERGFGESDYPTTKERRDQLLWDLAHIPQLAPLVLNEFGIDTSTAPADGPGSVQVERAAEDGGQLPDRENRELPDQPSRPPELEDGTNKPSGYAVLADMAVLHALEKAGERRRHRPGAPATLGRMPSHDVHTVWSPKHDQVDDLLSGVWDTVRDRLPRTVVDTLDAYTRHLLVSGLPHRRRALHAALKQAGHAA